MSLAGIGGAVVITAAGARWLAQRFAQQRIGPAWQRIPLVTPDGLREGQVQRVTGVVQAGMSELVEAPLTGRMCAAFELEMHGSDKGGLTGQAFSIEERSYASLTLRAGATTWHVDLEHARLVLGRRHRSPLRRASRDRHRRVLGRHGHSRSGNAGWRECVLLPGDTVTVAGLVVRDLPDDAIAAPRIYRQDLPTTIRLTGSAAHPVMLVAR